MNNFYFIVFCAKMSRFCCKLISIQWDFFSERRKYLSIYIYHSTLRIKIFVLEGANFSRNVTTQILMTFQCSTFLEYSFHLSFQHQVFCSFFDQLLLRPKVISFIWFDEQLITMRSNKRLASSKQSIDRNEISEWMTQIFYFIT